MSVKLITVFFPSHGQTLAHKLYDNKHKLFFSQVPDMLLISTSIDFTRGALIVESPRCKEKQQIALELSSCHDLKEEVHLYGQR